MEDLESTTLQSICLTREDLVMSPIDDTERGQSLRGERVGRHEPRGSCTDDEDVGVAVNRFGQGGG